MVMQVMWNGYIDTMLYALCSMLYARISSCFIVLLCWDFNLAPRALVWDDIDKGDASRCHGPVATGEEENKQRENLPLGGTGQGRGNAPKDV
jgi:hypothetical protein